MHRGHGQMQCIVGCLGRDQSGLEHRPRNALHVCVDLQNRQSSIWANRSEAAALSPSAASSKTTWLTNSAKSPRRVRHHSLVTCWSAAMIRSRLGPRGQQTWDRRFQIDLRFHLSHGESCGAGVAAQFKTTTKHTNYTKAIGLGPVSLDRAEANHQTVTSEPGPRILRRAAPSCVSGNSWITNPRPSSLWSPHR